MKKIFLFATLILGLGLMSCQSPESKARKALQEHFDKNAPDPKSIKIKDLVSVDTISFTKQEIETLDIKIKSIDKGISRYEKYIADDNDFISKSNNKLLINVTVISTKMYQKAIDELKLQKTEPLLQKTELEKLVGTPKEVIKVEWIFNVDAKLTGGPVVETQIGVYNKLNTDSFDVKLKRIGLLDLIK